MAGLQHEAARPAAAKARDPARRGIIESSALAQDPRAAVPRPAAARAAPPALIAPPLRRKRRRDPDPAAGSPAPPAALEAISEPGRDLSRSDLEFFGDRLGWDFSGVRLHEGPRADAGARSVGALAYTVGDHIVLGEERRGDRSLLAHELTHVVQQLGAPIATYGAPLIVAPDGGALEEEAERSATSLLGGAALRPRPSAAAAGVQRDTSTPEILSAEELRNKGWLPLVPYRASEKTVAEKTLQFLASVFPAIKVSIVFVLGDQLYGFTPGDLDHPRTWQLTGKGSIPEPGVIVGDARGQERLFVKGPDDKQEFYLTPVGFTSYNQLTLSSTITLAEEVDFLRRGVAVWVRPASESAAGGETKADGGQKTPAAGDGEKQDKKAQVPASRVPRTANEYEGGKGAQVTDPGWPAQLTGPDLQPLGGSGTYNMVLDWSLLGTQSDLLSMVTNQMSPINYFWEYFDITEISKKGLLAKQSEAMRHDPVSQADLVGPGAVIMRDAERRANDLAEDTNTSFQSMITARPDESASEVVGRIGVNYENLVLLPASALVSIGGFLIDSFTHLLSAYSNEQEIPWPNKPGVYMVRCIASPESQGNHRRAPSFALKIVEVRPTEWIARNTLGAAEADIKELEAAIRLEQDPKRKADLEKRLADAKVGVFGSAVDALRLAVKRQQATVDAATTDRFRQEDQLEALKKQLDRAEGRAAKYTGTSYRPRAAFASEVTGLTYPLVLQLGPLPKDGNRVVWMLSDDSAKEGGEYPAAGRTDEVAIWKAFEDFAGANGFGRGQLAVELPAEIKTVKTRTKVLRNADAGTTLLKSRLNDLVTILVALSLFIPGVGEVAAVIGGALAAERLWERYQKGTLDLTDPATIGDIIAVLAAAATALGSIGKLRLIRAQSSFALLGEDATEADALLATENLAKAEAFVKGSATFGQIINYGGLVWGNASTLITLVKISDQERDGTITHSEARRMRAEALLSGLQNNLLFIHGLREAQKAQAGGGEGEVTTTDQPGQRLPPGAGEGKSGVGVTPPEGIPVEGQPEVTAQGAVRGAKNYRLGGSAKMKSGEPSFEVGLDRVAGRRRPGVSIARSAPARPGSTSAFEMTVKTSMGADVRVAVTVEATPSLGGAGSHGDQSGPARVQLQKGATGWEAKILVRDRVFPDDVHLIVGHEFNEVAAILRDFPNADQATIGAQMEAGVFKPAGRGMPTAHDQAAALELGDAFAELEATRKTGSKDAVEAQKARLNRMLQSMGLDIEDPNIRAEPAALKERLDRLRDLGLAADLDARLRPTVEFLSARQRAPGATAALTVERVGHILFPEPRIPTSFAEFDTVGIGGGHLDSELIRFQGDHPEIHFQEVATKPMGGATAKKYQQNIYAPGGLVGVPPPGAEWGGPSFSPGDWKPSSVFKTTVTDSTVLLDEGASAWANFPGKPATPAGQVAWQSRSASGFLFSGYSSVDPSTGGWRITTFYPEQAWF